MPLMAMLRLARMSEHRGLARLVVSVRSPSELYYASELPGPEVVVAYTREAPTCALRPPGHLAASDLQGSVLPKATVFVCGSSGFADHVTSLLAQIDIAPERTRVERFGPTS